MEQGQEEGLKSTSYAAEEQVKCWWSQKMPPRQGVLCMFWTFPELLNWFSSRLEKERASSPSPRNTRGARDTWQWYQARGAPAPQPWEHIISLAEQQQWWSCTFPPMSNLLMSQITLGLKALAELQGVRMWMTLSGCQQCSWEGLRIRWLRLRVNNPSSLLLWAAVISHRHLQCALGPVILVRNPHSQGQKKLAHI